MATKAAKPAKKAVPKASRKPAAKKPAGPKKPKKPMIRPSAVKQAAFLAAYAETGNISTAAKASKIERKTHWDWMHGDATYPERFEAAKEQAIETLEAEARRRAVEGVEEPAGWYKGKSCGTVRKYSNTLLIFLLKGAAPEKYRERVDNKLSGGVNVSGEVRIYLPSNARPDGEDA
ncbi:MAG: hypothetical protein WBC44_09485 [Planctomycetaceae bacterium]